MGLSNNMDSEVEDEQYQILLDRLTNHTKNKNVDLPKQLAMFLHTQSHNRKLSALVIEKYRMRRADSLDDVASLLSMLLSCNSTALNQVMTFLKLVVIREDISYVTTNQPFVALLAHVIYLKLCNCDKVEDEIFSDAILLLYAFVPLRRYGLKMRDDFLLLFSSQILSICDDEMIAGDKKDDVKAMTVQYICRVWYRVVNDSKIAKTMPAIQIIGNNVTYFQKLKEWVTRHLYVQVSNEMESSEKGHGSGNYGRDLFTLDTEGDMNEINENTVNNFSSKSNTDDNEEIDDDAKLSENEDEITPLPKISIEQTPSRRRTRSLSASSADLESVDTPISLSRNKGKNQKSTSKQATKSKVQPDEIPLNENDEKTDEVRPLPNILVESTPSRRRTRSMSASSVELDPVLTPVSTKRTSKKNVGSTHKSSRKLNVETVLEDELLDNIPKDIQEGAISSPKSTSRRRVRTTLSNENSSPLGKRAKGSISRLSKKTELPKEMVSIDEDNDEVAPLPDRSLVTPARRTTRSMSISSVESETPSAALRRSARKSSAKKAK